MRWLSEGIQDLAKCPNLGSEITDRVKKEIQTEAETLKPIIRLEDITMWEMDKAKETKERVKTYTYWMASWREGNKVKNVHLGSCNKIDCDVSLRLVKEKGKSFGNLSLTFFD